MRRNTNEVLVGGVGIGGDNPIRIQSMTNTETADVPATVAQIIQLTEAGSELVRITVNTPEAAKAVPLIKEGLLQKNVSVPLIGDFHFNGHILLRDFPGCAEALDKYRVNPGNARGFREMIEIAIARKKPVRIGVNGGSLDQTLLTNLMNENARQGQENLKSDKKIEIDAAVISVLSSAREAEGYGLPSNQIIVSAKFSDVREVIRVNRLIAHFCHYPIHLGLTEAGPGVDGVVASVTALSILLQEEIGDTIRVSLTPGPNDSRTMEVSVCKSVLQSLGLRQFAPRISACPGCGRSKNEFYLPLAKTINEAVALRSSEWKTRFPGSEALRIAVMGCVVNGPGESKGADIGISLPGGGEAPRAQVFVNGRLEKTLVGENLAEQFMAILEEYVANRFSH